MLTAQLFDTIDSKDYYCEGAVPNAKEREGKERKEHQERQYELDS